jgi:phosphoribosylformylglycinamidine synthase
MAAGSTLKGMSQPRVIVLRTAGTNCDGETVHAWELAGARPERVHVHELIDRPKLLDEFGILTIAGGFSYGDDISAGKILAGQLIHHLAEALNRFVESGKLVLGICNGFQVLVKAGLLPGPLGENGADDGTSRQAVTLTQNDSAKFEARWICLKPVCKTCAFLPPDTVLEMPIAHGEGKLVTRDETVRRELGARNRIALTYCDTQGQRGDYPVNPNGSECDIAGLTDATGRILGLMPHPERHVHPTQHPHWTRRSDTRPDGRQVFESAVRAARAS